ncbi:MAG: cyclic nucleotide-binding domain-containing protein, partial [Pseudomonadales bacterium]|nr:cyclic nucleotide-binding domain-containing protein [Pseudomonadales bacterium]
SYGFHIVITGADEEDVHRLEGIDFMTEPGATWQHIRFDQLDDGVAWCEERILREMNVVFMDPDENLIHVLILITQDDQIARDIVPWFTTERRAKGEYLFRQGEKGDSLYLVSSGSAAVVIEDKGQQRVLRRYRAGAILGEMALYTGDTRSASVVIEQDAVLYRLTIDQLHAMEEAHPHAAGLLHAYVVRVLSERLNRANRELQRYL